MAGRILRISPRGIQAGRGGRRAYLIKRRNLAIAYEHSERS